MVPPPVTLQVTDWFDELFTVAVNCLVVETGTLALEGDTVTVTGGGGGVIVTEAVPFAEVSAWLVA